MTNRPLSLSKNLGDKPGDRELDHGRTRALLASSPILWDCALIIDARTFVVLFDLTILFELTFTADADPPEGSLGTPLAAFTAFAAAKARRFAPALFRGARGKATDDTPPEAEVVGFAVEVVVIVAEILVGACEGWVT